MKTTTAPWDYQRNDRQSIKEMDLTIALLSGEITKAEFERRWFEIHPKKAKKSRKEAK